MNKISRRELARYAADELLAGKSASDVAKGLAATIIELRQNIEVEFLLEDIAWELEQRRELVVGRITSTHKLASETRELLVQHIKKATGGKEVMLREKQDSSLIGGLRIETASRVWDYSVARRLADLREAFNV